MEEQKKKAGRKSVVKKHRLPPKKGDLPPLLHSVFLPSLTDCVIGRKNTVKSAFFGRFFMVFFRIFLEKYGHLWYNIKRVYI